MQDISIYYCFKLVDKSEVVFNLHLDDRSCELIDNIPDTLPEWTWLEFQKCPHCPLNPAKHPYCPLAANMVNIVKRFAKLCAHENLHLDVVTPERTISQNTTTQAGLGSLMGLVIATSGCPHTAFFKPMARFHLPLSSTIETIYRATSMYMMAQYYLHGSKKEVDLELKGLNEIYENIHIVNTSIARRFQVASMTDSTVEAVVQLDLHAMTFLGISEETLQEIRYFFIPYLLKSMDT